MTQPQSAQAANRIAYAGEQILSYLDEISREACPKCGEHDLTAGVVGKSIVVRCSVALHNYNSEDYDDTIENVCTYAHVIRRVALTDKPFTLGVEEKGRATAKNVKVPVRRRRST